MILRSLVRRQAFPRALGALALGGMIAGSGLAQPRTAQASLLGSQLTLEYHFGGSTYSTDLITVGAGVEVTCTGGGSGNTNVCTALSAPNQSIDIGAYNIHYTYAGVDPGGFNNIPDNGMRFVGLNPGGTITGYTLDTGISGLDSWRILLSGNLLDIYMGGLALGYSNYFDITLQVEQTSVPEPATLALLGLGLAGIAAIRRRRA